MISEERFKELLSRYTYIVIHRYQKQIRLLYKGENRHIAEDMTCNFSPVTEFYRKGVKINVR